MRGMEQGCEIAIREERFSAWHGAGLRGSNPGGTSVRSMEQGCGAAIREGLQCVALEQAFGIK